MATANFEVPSGAVDGVNKDFFTSLPYRAGTVAVFRNGQPLTRVLADGWTETDLYLGQVTLNEAPLVGDVIQIFYTVAAGADAGAAEEEVCGLRGKLRDVDRVRGRLLEVEVLHGRVRCVENG